MSRSFERGPQGYREAPSRTWPDHTGKPVPDAAYPVPPDGSLGEVLTAWSNQSVRGLRPRTRKQIIGLAVLFVILGGMLTFFGGAGLGWVLEEAFGMQAMDHWATFALAGAVAVGLGWLVSRQRASCNYVGTEGIAEHADQLWGRSDQLLRFEDATTLKVGETNRYTNGVYQGTDFVFTWSDRTGAKLFEGRGTRFIQGMWKDLDVPAWSFLCAAEVRWNEHRWGLLEALWEEHGYLRFGDLVVREGELQIDGETLAPEDLEGIFIDQGFMKVQRVGAKQGIFRSTGIHTRAVRDIADFPLLIRALRRWGGFQV